jgi:hypothetical protein
LFFCHNAQLLSSRFLIVRLLNICCALERGFGVSGIAFGLAGLFVAVGWFCVPLQLLRFCVLGCLRCLGGLRVCFLLCIVPQAVTRASWLVR